MAASVFLFLLSVGIATCYLVVNPPSHPSDRSNKSFEHPEGALILTPLIEAGQIEEARKQARVDLSPFSDVESYSGYLTVNQQYDSNMFFWFFPSENNYESAPVVLWLQGGPGGSSLYGLFEENGPFEIFNNSLLDRAYSWTRNYSMLYIDNPVGTGFSFTNEYYVTNQTEVGDHLYKALSQFFEVFPELQKNDFFISGESYGGKYVPAAAYTILERNEKTKNQINLKGLAIVNGWTDPENQFVYSEYLYQVGLLDFNGKLHVGEAENYTKLLIEQKSWEAATASGQRVLGQFSKLSGIGNLYNYIESDGGDLAESDSKLEKWLNRPDVRESLHVGNAKFLTLNTIVYYHLASDMMKSVSDWVATLLEHYKVMFLTGQLDIIVPYPSTVNFLEHLKFNAAEEYKYAERQIWHVDDEVAGYVKQAGNLTEVMVRVAGHMVPKHQPKRALDLMNRFVFDLPID